MTTAEHDKNPIPQIDALVAAQRATIASSATAREKLIADQKQVVTEILERINQFKQSVPFTTERKESRDEDTVIFRPHTSVTAVSTKSWFKRTTKQVTHGEVEIRITPKQSTPRAKFTIWINWNRLGDRQLYEQDLANKSQNGIVFPPEPANLDELMQVLICIVAVCKYRLEEALAALNQSRSRS